MDNFQKKLETLINQTNQEKVSNTPDFILAEFLTKMKNVFDYAVNKREAWYKTPAAKFAPGAIGQKDERMQKDEKAICQINDIPDINRHIPEGRLLMAALAILTTENWTDQTPGEALARVGELATHMYEMTPEQSRAQPLSWKPNEERDELKTGFTDKSQAKQNLDDQAKIREMYVPGFTYTTARMPGKILKVLSLTRYKQTVEISVYPIGESEHSTEAFKFLPALDAEIFNFTTGKNKPVKETPPPHPFKPGYKFQLKDNFGNVFTVQSVDGESVATIEDDNEFRKYNQSYTVMGLLKGLKDGLIWEYKAPAEGIKEKSIEEIMKVAQKYQTALEKIKDLVKQEPQNAEFAQVHKTCSEALGEAGPQHERGGLKTEAYKGWD